MAPLTHLDAEGRARMVQVDAKPETARTARASARVIMQAGTLDRIVAGSLPKGDVLQVARIAAIQATKRTAELIPLCHPLRITGVQVDFAAVPNPADADDGLGALQIRVEVRAFDRTGVEMEALTAATIAGLTIYDMCKAIDRGMRLSDVQLDEKQGGKSGHWHRE
ncbi:MAG: cyclic pyranopterin monophosphate synthase MoaC [Polyangia bacterium]